MLSEETPANVSIMFDDDDPADLVLAVMYELQSEEITADDVHRFLSDYSVIEIQQMLGELADDECIEYVGIKARPWGLHPIPAYKVIL